MKATLEIQNLKCGGCANTIFKNVSNLETITALEINNENNTVTFQYKNNTVLKEVKVLLNHLGYPVVGNKNGFTTKAKSFVSCAVGRIK